MLGSAPQFSVSDFVAVFNQALDVAFPEVIIVGEVANFKISKNQWVYMDLKDEFATVRFFGSVRSLSGPLEDGMVVEVVGRPYLHPLYSFSVQLQSVEPVGQGSINKALLLLTKKLESEGLFEEERKRELPYAPQKIGLIASTESAGYGDFLKIISARWPMMEVEVFNTLVQGRDAPATLCSAIEKANLSSGLDVLVIIRGGGSKDDLSAFDHETVVRAVSASRTPTLVAIGHDRDESLSERVADMRASTPSNAAELLVPDRSQEITYLAMMSEQLDNKLNRFSEPIKAEIFQKRHLLDELLLGNFRQSRTYVDIANQLLSAYDPRMPLMRGYALVSESASGKLVKSREQALHVSELSLEFKDGIVKARSQKA